MTILEAYDFTFTKIKELEECGIEVIIKKVIIKNSAQLQDSKKYPLSPELWKNVNFKIKSKADADKVHEMANYLGLCGISFDTGGFKDRRNWEIDWSFNYRPGDENEDWRDRREECERMIRKLK